MPAVHNVEVGHRDPIGGDGKGGARAGELSGGVLHLQAKHCGGDSVGEFVEV